MNLICVSTGSQNGNCYLLKSGDGHYIILDCGAKYTWLQRACNHMVSEIDFALVTHSHKDHSICIPHVLEDAIDVYGPQEVSDVYAGVKTLREREIFRHMGWIVLPFAVPHTHNNGEQCQNYAYLIIKDNQCLLYMTDWMYCRYNMQRFNINHFLIAVNYTELDEEADGNIRHVAKGHSSLDTALEFLKTSAVDGQCRSIIACHLSTRNADPVLIQKTLSTIAPTIIAEKGNTYELH